jgi:actin-like ATPase involved in cell morphogenesis
MAYQVGIDLGTSSAVAAVCRPDGTAHVVPLDDGTGAMAAAVYLGADGTLLVGDAAERRALSDPGRVVRELTRRVGDATPLLVGREPVGAAELAARVLARLVDDVARREGGVAARVAVTHPGAWGPHRVGSLRAALAEQGLGSAVLVPEPVAAVAAYAATAAVPPGAAVGVHDLGGGRFAASVVRSGPDGLALVGTSEEIERHGGAELDEVVFAHVRAALGAAWDALDPTDPDVLAAVADLRRECTAAKEALSRDTEVLVPVAVPGVRTQVRLGRAEFEETIRPGVAETVEAMRRALDDAGVPPAELAVLVLVGGSARVPLVPQLLGEAFGREVAVVADPVGAAAVGAALLAGAAGRRPPGRPEAGRAAARSGADAASRRSDAPHGASAPSAAGAGADPDAGAGAGAGGTGGGTEVLPVARPPKQARPFTTGSGAAPSRPRRVVLLASAAALLLAVLGGVVAFGAGRLGAGTEAGAQTPVPVVDAGVPGSVTGPPTGPGVAPPAPGAASEGPARPGSPPTPRRARQASPPAPTPPAPGPPAPTSSAPPAGRAPTGSAPPDEPAGSAPAEPAPGDGVGDGAGAGGAGDDGGGNGGGDAGAGSGRGAGAGTDGGARGGGAGAGGAGAAPASAAAAGGRGAGEGPVDG